MKSQVTRRDFLQQGALAVSAPVVLGLAGQAFAQGSGKTLNCGMIGTGGRGRSLLAAVVQVPDVRVAALCDIDGKALDQALKITGSHQPKTYTLYKDMLQQKDLHAVFVSTPPFLHKPMIVDVLRAGLNCYSEKPMSTTVNELEDVTKVAKQSKGILQVGQQLRYRTAYRGLMPRIHAGELGKIGFVRAQRYSTWSGPGSQEEMRWLYSIEESGDQIVEQSVHELDVINWIMGDHPVRIAGLGGQNMIFEPEGNDICDHYGLTLEYPGGRHAIFSMLKYAAPGEMGGTFIHAYGEKGSADASYRGDATMAWRGANPQAPVTIENKDPDMNLNSVSDFFRCIREGQQPFCNVDTGRTAALTALLGRKAIYERRVVAWEDLLKEGAPLQPVRG